MSRPLDWNTDGRDWPHRQASSFVRAAGIRWHVQQLGSGPVLLLIHGTGGSTHSWRDVMPLLAREFSCVSVDLPGHGFSEMPSRDQLSLDGMSQALGALMSQLQLQPVAIVGHSAGAAIAAQLCLHEKVQAELVVACNGAFFPFDGLAGLVFPQVARLMASNSIASRLFAWRAADRVAVRRLIENTGSRLDARGEELYGRLVRNPVHVSAALGMMARWNVASLLAGLPALGSHLHLVAGEGDRAVPPAQSREVQRLVPGASLTMVAGAGHLAHEEMPVRLASIVSQAAHDALLQVAKRA
jgi:magnesium chelatase accessory protein